MKRNILATAIAGMTTLSGSWAATAAEVEFHGDMDNRFQAYTNQRDWFAGGNSGGGASARSNIASGRRQLPTTRKLPVYSRRRLVASATVRGRVATIPVMV